MVVGLPTYFIGLMVVCKEESKISPAYGASYDQFGYDVDLLETDLLLGTP